MVFGRVINSEAGLSDYTRTRSFCKTKRSVSAQFCGEISSIWQRWGLKMPGSRDQDVRRLKHVSHQATHSIAERSECQQLLALILRHPGTADCRQSSAHLVNLFPSTRLMSSPCRKRHSMQKHLIRRPAQLEPLDATRVCLSKAQAAIGVRGKLMVQQGSWGSHARRVTLNVDANVFQKPQHTIVGGRAPSMQVGRRGRCESNKKKAALRWLRNQFSNILRVFAKNPSLVHRCYSRPSKSSVWGYIEWGDRLILYLTFSLILP